ncbi:MAG: excinuclease ABC subunit UvrC [Hyphomicrobiaceae bacterium]|nr:excinuclease ABC subunit UvrC [Hyphomicrobiaceae bacterium]
MSVKTTHDVPLGPAAPDAAQPTKARTVHTGPHVIAQYLKSLPGSPGVYRMLDAAGTVIYVGKARNLKARVTNYARAGNHTNRITRMIANTASMEVVTVRTEAEALLLEANLIKRFRPRYNVLLRDDKSFPYILITGDHRAPQILKHRGARKRKGEYFGPFASAGAVNRTINMLERAFLLRSCSDAVFDSRTRPCLLHQIKRCSAPCTSEINLEDYNGLVGEAVRFLRGESQNVREMYQRLMQEAANRLDYEQAAKYRNRLWALAHVTADQAINPEGIEEADVFAAHQDGGQTCVQVFFFRSGQNWGNRAYFPRADKSIGAEDVLESFIAQFYDDKPVPRLILLSHELPNRELLADALSTKAERKVEIRVPQRGTKTGVVEHALQNAREALARKLAESSSQRTLLEGLRDRFGLTRTPRRIEVFDNSHIMGTNAVGAMIVAGQDGFVKNQYRKFNIKTEGLTPGDDYAMMREVLTRRMKRLLLDGAEAPHGVGPPQCDAESRPIPDGAMGAEGEPCSDRGPRAGSDLPAEVPDGLAPARTQGSATGRAGTSLIEPPAPPPIDRRGGSSLAFGVLRADEAQAATTSLPSGLAETEEETLQGNAQETSPPETDETGDEFPAKPDLMLIDGGLGQLGVAQEVIETFGIEGVALIGVAKGPDRDAGREHFHLPGRAFPMMLEPRDPVLYFVQRLRDEAHRFAIGTHRAKRAKALGANPLDEIPGIGPGRKRALLRHFGSAKAVSRAGKDDLEAVQGISANMAQAIYDFFHERHE